MLKRNSVGYEIDLELIEVAKEKMGFRQSSPFDKGYDFDIIIRDDARHLRTQSQRKVRNQRSVVKNAKRKTR